MWIQGLGCLLIIGLHSKPFCPFGDPRFFIYVSFIKVERSL